MKMMNLKKIVLLKIFTIVIRNEKDKVKKKIVLLKIIIIIILNKNDEV